MPIQSPLTNIVDVIRQIVNSAEQYSDTLHKNEAATRAVLIDPVLRALGWDTANTYMVEVEKSLDQTRVDYALYDNNSDVRVVIEAKPLGANMNQQSFIISLLTYAFTYGLKDVFLVDGLNWQHYSDFKPGNIIPVHCLNLAKDDPVESAAYLVQMLDAAKFWPQDQDIDTIAQQVTQLESAVSSLQRELADLRGSQSLKLNDTHTSPTAKPKYELLEFKKLPDIVGKKPTYLRLPDGKEFQVSTWKDILVECCKFALAVNPNIQVPLPDRTGRKVSLLNTTRPPKGLSHVEIQYSRKTIFLYTNYDSNHCIINAEHILNQVPKELRVINPAIAIE